MSNECHEVEQLRLEFDVKDGILQKNSTFSGLSLVVNNSKVNRPNSAVLHPNSPEITQIIRSLGKSLSW